MARETIILYQGASLINGQPIVALAQSESNNKKTGNMIQTFILDATVDPLTASRTGRDASICGSCPHRGTPNNNDKGQATDRTCYVTLAHAPLGKYKAYKKGVYGTKTATLKEIESFGSLQGVRLGTYGDPCAVNNEVWKALTSKALYSTAYTHAAINPMPESIMTSTDNLKQSVDAWSRNERTFRVISHIDQLYKRREILCPASEESAAIRNAPRSTCASCKLCGGANVNAKSIAIVAHGTSKRKAKEIVQ
jgi:hypothetical protein